MKWNQSGSRPDYRFSLANERTFLAWIRTALAFLAVGIGLDQLAVNFFVPFVKPLIVLLLCGFSAFLAIHAFVRWRANEQAMRHDKPLSYTRGIVIASSFMFCLAILTLWGMNDGL